MPLPTDAEKRLEKQRAYDRDRMMQKRADMRQNNPEAYLQYLAKVRLAARRRNRIKRAAKLAELASSPEKLAASVARSKAVKAAWRTPKRRKSNRRNFNDRIEDFERYCDSL